MANIDADNQGKDVEQPEVASSPTEPGSDSKKEQKEAVPELRLTVARRCNTEGLYVGLNSTQKKALGVEKGGLVELFDGDHRIGIYQVGAHLEELEGQNEVCSANNVPDNAAVTVRKAPEKIEGVFNYKVGYGAEQIPADMQADKRPAYQARLAGRIAFIKEVRPEGDPEAYIIVPTPIARALGSEPTNPKKPGVLNPGFHKLRFGGKVMVVPMVAAGDKISFSTASQKELGIPDGVKEMGVRIEYGPEGERMLVID
jgi:hypothetical protein